MYDKHAPYIRLNISFTLPRCRSTKCVIGFEINLQDSRDQYVVMFEGNDIDDKFYAICSFYRSDADGLNMSALFKHHQVVLSKGPNWIFPQKD